MPAPFGATPSSVSCGPKQYPRRNGADTAFEAYTTVSDSEADAKIAAAVALIPVGPQGPQGIQGPQGLQGAQGVAGAKGDTGDAGPSGVQGPQGVKGDKGDTGDTGPAGSTGATGPAGADGLDGADGAQGPEGPQGLKGDTGDAGPQGTQGIQGIQGTQGPKGDTGNQGVQGVQGDVGAQGPKGDPGSPALSPTIGTVTPKTLNSTFGLSPTRMAHVTYTIALQVTNPLLAGSAFAGCYLEYSLNGGGTWAIVCDVEAQLTVGLAVSIAITSRTESCLSGFIPANAIVRLRSETSGAAGVTYVRGQEVLI